MDRSASSCKTSVVDLDVSYRQINPAASQASGLTKLRSFVGMAVSAYRWVLAVHSFSTSVFTSAILFSLTLRF